MTTTVVRDTSTNVVTVATGPQGPQGVAGSAGTVAVGTVTTGSPGSAATVTNSGSSTAAVLNFSIPTGPTGPFGGASFQYLYSTSTSDADPGDGKIALNNIALASATALYIDDVDKNDVDIQAFLRTIDDPTSTVKGHVKIIKEANAGDFRLYTISNATEENGYHKVTCAYVSGTGSFSANEALIVTFARTGDKGDAGVDGGTNILLDTSPQLGGNLDVHGKDITSTNNGDVNLDPHGTGSVVFKGNTGSGGNGAGRFKLNCENNSHGITVQGPPHSASASYTLTLPNDAGSGGEVLKTDGSGNLDWVAQTAAYTNDSVKALLGTTGAQNGQVLGWTGSAFNWVAQSTGGGSTSPGGSNTQIQFNNQSSFGGSSNLTFDGTNLACGGKVSATTSAASNANNLRKITTSTASPSGGSDGDIWIKYTA